MEVWKGWRLGLVGPAFDDRFGSQESASPPPNRNTKNNPFAQINRKPFFPKFYSKRKRRKLAHAPIQLFAIVYEKLIESSGISVLLFIIGRSSEKRNRTMLKGGSISKFGSTNQRIEQ